jgi:hypothetical protein
MQVTAEPRSFASDRNSVFQVFSTLCGAGTTEIFIFSGYFPILSGQVPKP